jgi:superfamily I DNA/RNA helicase
MNFRMRTLPRSKFCRCSPDGGECFCRGRSGSGDLPVSRRFERSIHFVRQRNFPAARVVVLGKNRRSLSPILRCAFGIVNENPAVFAKRRLEKRSGKRLRRKKSKPAISYQRTPLGIAARRGGEAQRGRDGDRAARRNCYLERQRGRGRRPGAPHPEETKSQRCGWSDFAVLYRQHSHRDELVKELAERGIPFSIEGLDVLDTPEVRDVVACLTAAVSPNDAASLVSRGGAAAVWHHPVELRPR